MDKIDTEEFQDSWHDGRVITLNGIKVGLPLNIYDVFVVERWFQSAIEDIKKAVLKD